MTAVWLALGFGVLALIVLLGWLNHHRSKMHFQKYPLTCRCGYKAENIWELQQHIDS